MPAGISWGFFSGGFDLTLTNANGTTGCSRSTTSAVTATKKADYIPHHQPFQYYASTANPTHTRPTSVATIGQPGDAGNHQYDIHDFFDAVSAGQLPGGQLSEGARYQDGHAGYSDPLDEQTFIVNTINFLEQQPDWNSTAVIITYDDSDGWYDHQMGPIVNTRPPRRTPYRAWPLRRRHDNALPGVSPGTSTHRVAAAMARVFLCIAISPWAKINFVDHTVTDQSSVPHFIEDNWLGGERIGQGSFDSIRGHLVLHVQLCTLKAP